MWIQQRISVFIDTMECIRFVEDSFIEDTIYPNRCFFFTHTSQGIIGKVLAQWQRDEMKGNMQLWRTKPHSLLWIVPLWSGWTHTEHSQGLIYLHLHQVHNSHLLFKTWVYCLENCSHEKTCICIDIKTYPVPTVPIAFGAAVFQIWPVVLNRCLSMIKCIYGYLNKE